MSRVQSYTDQASTLKLIEASSIEPKPIDWLWPGWLARGKLHILAGAPSTGKTTLAIAIAANISRGGTWPDGTSVSPGRVVIWSGEDDPEDTLIPRLLAAGADMTRIHIVDEVYEAVGSRSFDPATDVNTLAKALANLPEPPTLLIVDPIVSAVGGDSHKNAETRRALGPLVNLVQKQDCALIGITHFSKGTAGREPLERITGSLAFGAMARIVLVTARRPDDHPDGPSRMLVRAKSNIGADGDGFQYEIAEEGLEKHPGLVATKTIWSDPIQGTARELLTQAEIDPRDSEPSALKEAEDFLRSLLMNGPVSSKMGNAQAKELGISPATLCRARSKLGIKPSKTRFDGGWSWEIP